MKDCDGYKIVCNVKNCKLPAIWAYDPDVWYECDLHARHPCSCNLELKPDVEEIFDLEGGIVNPDSDYELEKDEDGRDLPCCEFSYVGLWNLGWFARQVVRLKLRWYAWLSKLNKYPGSLMTQKLSVSDYERSLNMGGYINKDCKANLAYIALTRLHDKDGESYRLGCRAMAIFICM